MFYRRKTNDTPLWYAVHKLFMLICSHSLNGMFMICCTELKNLIIATKLVTSTRHKKPVRCRFNMKNAQNVRIMK